MSAGGADSNGTDTLVSLLFKTIKSASPFIIEELMECNRHIVFTELFWGAQVDL